MLTVNKYNFQTGKIHNSSYRAFKSTKEERIKKMQAQQAKQSYIASKTATLDDITTLTLFSSLFLGAHNIDLSRKLTTKEWFASGLLIIGTVSLITLLIKKDQYAKEYDKEMKK